MVVFLVAWVCVASSLAFSAPMRERNSSSLAFSDSMRERNSSADSRAVPRQRP